LTESTTITASALVTFDTGADTAEHLSAQIDDRADGLNSGKTSFKPGDDPVFLVWCSIPAKLAVEAVGGPVSKAGSAITKHDQDVTDYMPSGETEIEVQISPPARGLPTMKWETSAAGITLSAGKMLGNGSIASVLFKRLKAPPPTVLAGRWLVSNLSWTASAEDYRITTAPTTTAKRVVLLASATPD